MLIHKDKSTFSGSAFDATLWPLDLDYFVFSGAIERASCCGGPEDAHLEIISWNLSVLVFL